MSTLSFTGKQWLEPMLRTSNDPFETLAMIATARSLGAESRPWEDGSTYPMATKAAERLKHAAKKGETIGIIGDYDCDGLTSTTILVRLIRRLGARPLVRLPHRLREGYGAQTMHVDEMHDAGVTLLFMTDTGIVAHDALARAKERGMDVIILDHHAFTELPEAFAILHPALTTLISPPSAAGVAFAFAHAVEGTHWNEHSIDLALAMTGTIADVMPLTHENRTMVKDGLVALSGLASNTGLGALRDRSGMSKTPTATDIAFRLAPRLNAAGRLDDAIVGLSALLGDLTRVDELERLNAQRQQLTRDCMEEAFAMIDETTLSSFLCVASKNFPKGIVGLIAGKLTEKYGRPSAAIAIDDGRCTASLRGIPGHDIAAALRNNAALFTTFGGHALAGGCSFLEKNLAEVAAALDADVRSTVSFDVLHPTLTIDALADASHLSLALVDALSTLEPFGQGNREPLFLVSGLSLKNVRRVGNDAQHLQAKNGDIGIIGFGLGDLAGSLSEPVDLACRVTANVWNSTKNVQLSAVDIRSAQTGASLPSISNAAMTGTFKADAIL